MDGKREILAARSITDRTNWAETRSKHICRSIEHPCTWISARSDWERYGCSVINLPRIVKWLTNINICDRRYSLWYRNTLGECKAVESVFLLDKLRVTTIIWAILFSNDPFQFIFFHTTPDASRVLLFVATLGDFISSFEQSSLPPRNNQPIRTRSAKTQSRVTSAEITR